MRGPDSRKHEKSNFKTAIESRSKASRSRIILALDIEYGINHSALLSQALSILRETSRYLCAVKLNFHLLLPLSLGELAKLNSAISSRGLVSIADLKLNDIDNTNRVATRYLWSAGFSAVIANPFVGFESGLDVVLKESRALGKGVILLAYMSHKAADEGYGLRLQDGRTLHQLFLERAKRWKADGVVIGTTRPAIIKSAREFLGKGIKIFAPGSGAQGGDFVSAVEAGADYLIFGRSIVGSRDPKEAVKRIYRSQLAWTKNH